MRVDRVMTAYMRTAGTMITMCSWRGSDTSSAWTQVRHILASMVNRSTLLSYRQSDSLDVQSCVSMPTGRATIRRSSASLQAFAGGVR